MKDLFRQARIDMLFSSILCILFGIVLIWKPNETLSFFCQLLAIGLIVVGVLLMTSFFLSFVTSGASLVMGIVIGITGIVLLIHPEWVQVIIPVIIGIALLYHSVEEFKMAFASKKMGSESWTRTLIFAIITLLLAAACIIGPFLVAKSVMMLLGAALIYNGISNIFVTRRYTKVTRDYEQNHDPIDVEFKD